MSATDGDDDDETRQHGHDEHGHKDDGVDLRKAGWRWG